jgi:endoglucanase
VRRLAIPAVLAACSAVACEQSPMAAAGERRVPLAGINLAGGEFNAARKPGRYGKDYIYPSARTAAPFAASGMQIVRVPVLWERLQPQPGEPLDVAEMKRVDKALAALGTFRIIVLDVHNYGKRNGERLDLLPNGDAQLAELWTLLARHYAGDRRIAFGLMNEPNGIPASVWRAMVDRSVRAIRDAGARNLILVPGTNWTGAHSWTRGGAKSNAAAFVDFRDPGGNFAFEMHQYLDANNSGTNSECVDPATAARRIEPATEWLRRNRHRGFLGELGAASNEACLESLSALLDAVQRAPDVWFGWAYWAGGDWWGKYPMNVQPSRDGPKPQMAVLTRFAEAGGR